METRITATEAARNFSDILNRVRYREERFVIVRSGEIIAQIIAPDSNIASVDGKQLLSLLQNLGAPDADFARDLQKIRDGQEFQVPKDKWPSS